MAALNHVNDASKSSPQDANNARNRAPAETTSLLEYMRSKTQVDLDSLNLDLAKELGPFADCTSNQADSYFEFQEPSRQDLVKSSVRDAFDLLPELHGKLLPAHEDGSREDVTAEELAVEIAMTRISLTMIPLIQGRIFVMANPSVALSTPKTVACGRRIAAIARYYEPTFDLDRLCIKVASTWEGLQACKILGGKFGINTLATTLFTMEQAMLAGEVGCIFVSPFVHELRVHFDESYHDKDPIFDIVLQAQKFYRQHQYATKVKACSVVNVEEVLKLAGVDAFTIAPALLRDLAASHTAPEEVRTKSIFHAEAAENGNGKGSGPEKRPSVNKEVAWRDAYAKSDNGKGRVKTTQAIALFCEYQFLAEGVVRTVAAELDL
ncbi:transaldolase [Tothia fuscella]|uniref:Transaldolase n=1 Tax=Tothia fuscella TaxID=1048955 RepID=A0A9P4NGS2_9PEZI|nr:transaldolase [Tothia fuscella]